MAYENYAGSAPVTFPTATTGLARWRFASLSTAGNAQYSVAGGGGAVGAIIDGTTGSTSANNISVSVQLTGIAKVSAPASTVGVGQTVTASSLGQAVPVTAGDVAVGLVVAGSSGAAGRILSILLGTPAGSTATA